MGFFDKFKKKVSDTVNKTVESTELVKKRVSESVSKTIESTTESVKKSTDFLRFDRLKIGLEKTKKTFSNSILSLIGGRKIDDNLLNEIEEILLTSDIGVNTTDFLINKLKSRVKEEKIENAELIYGILKEEIYKLLVKSSKSDTDKNYSIEQSSKPHIILIIGVNGVGKTTTIGKLAFNYKETGNSVIVGAADTFRAAANEQLNIWAERVGVDIIQLQHGSDPGAVVFDTVKTAKTNNTDIVLIDTAGRLHNKSNLMAELEKLSRIIKKHKETGPDEVFLILDATTGQNAILQAKEFQKVANITGIILTKLDGTAKGGVVISISNELNIPVRYIGVGEQMYDLQPFEPINFVEALFGSEKGEETELVNSNTTENS